MLVSATDFNVNRCRVAYSCHEPRVCLSGVLIVSAKQRKTHSTSGSEVSGHDNSLLAIENQGHRSRSGLGLARWSKVRRSAWPRSQIESSMYPSRQLMNHAVLGTHTSSWAHYNNISVGLLSRGSIRRCCLEQRSRTCVAAASRLA